MDCEKCKIDRYKELLKRRSAKIQAQAETIHELIEENEQLKEELRQICHENEMLWRYRMGDGASDASRHKAERKEQKALKKENLQLKRDERELLKELRRARAENERLLWNKIQDERKGWGKNG